MSAGPRNIVICLDGTGNHIEENLSNVLKLYRTVIKDEEQIVFYDQGVGTLSSGPRPENRDAVLPYSAGLSP